MFTDGIYGFAVKLEMNKKKLDKLIVKDLSVASEITEKPIGLKNKTTEKMPQNVA